MGNLLLAAYHLLAVEQIPLFGIEENILVSGADVIVTTFRQGGGGLINQIKKCFIRSGVITRSGASVTPNSKLNAIFHPTASVGVKAPLDMAAISCKTQHS